jgi:hypothetical protein
MQGEAFQSSILEYAIKGRGYGFWIFGHGSCDICYEL